MENLIYSSDSDLLQSNLIVFNVNCCLWLDYNCENDNYTVYNFDLLDEVENWIELNNVNNTCDTNYTIDYFDTILLTQDVCYYYGAINLDNCPDIYTKNELIELFNKLKILK